MKRRENYLKGGMLLLLIGLSLSVFAQSSITVRGNITDTQGEPIIGATILERGNRTNGTATDFDGNYTLSNVASNATLEIAFVGMQTLTVAVNGRTVVDATLSEDSELLDELVVVGFGVQRRANLTGAVSTIDSRALVNRPIQNVSNALQGLAAGVTVQSGSGRPGEDGARVRVRGIGTLNVDHAGPLVLVDGIETGNWNSIDPNDIESISVLRDAGSAAIYGSKAANGVILITTRRGRAGGKPIINYNGTFSVMSPSFMVERLSSYDYARLMKGAEESRGVVSRWTDRDLELFRDGSSPWTHPNTDWLGSAFRNAFQQQHSLSASGGTATSDYMFSVGYLGQEGMLPNSERKQFNARMNLGLDITDKLNVRMNMSYIKNDHHDPTNSYVRGGSGQLIRQLNTLAPWIVGRFPDGTYGPTADGNPLAWLDSGQQRKHFRENFVGSLQAEYKIADGLTAMMRGAYTSSSLHRHEFSHSFIYQPGGEYSIATGTNHPENRLNELFQAWNRAQFDATLNYVKSFGRHNLSALAGWSTEAYNLRENGMERRNFPNNLVTDMNAGAAATQTNSGFTRQARMLSGFGRINYDFAGKYLFEANVRADASSRFHPNHRWGYFPSFSAGWRITEEDFMANTRDWLQQLRVRGSLGWLGDQHARGEFYPWVNTYAIVNYPFGGALTPGFAHNTNRVPTISWEDVRTYGVGLDVTFLNNFNLTVDYYDRKTSGILMSVPSPAEFALGNYVDNVGVVSNKGVEIAAGYARRWGDFSVQTNLNMSYNHNRIISLGLDAEGKPRDMIIDGNTIMRVGERINAWHLYKSDGLFQSQAEVDAFLAKYNTSMFSQTFRPGDIRYVNTHNTYDSNGNPDNRFTADDRVTLNSAMPDYVFGWSTTFTWKQFDLSMLLTAQLGGSQIFTTESFGAFSGDAHHPATWWLNAWTEENRNNKVPRIWDDQFSNSDQRRVRSDFWLFSTDYLRVKNLQLGYNLPSQLLNNIGVQRLRLFYTGENLLTFHKLPLNVDPESGSENLSNFPIAKTHAIGINLTF